MKQEIGQNVNYEVHGNSLIIRVDLEAEATPSASGKTRVVASSKGNKRFEYRGKDFFLGLNVYYK